MTSRLEETHSYLCMDCVITIPIKRLQSDPKLHDVLTSVALVLHRVSPAMGPTIGPSMFWLTYRQPKAEAQTVIRPLVRDVQLSSGSLPYVVVRLSGPKGLDLF